MKNTALITGATSGIGQATARIFAKNGIDLVITGRRTERLEALQAELSQKVKVTTLNFDVRDRQAVFAAIDSLSDEWKVKINILVNNAGNAHGLAKFQDADLDDFDAMIDGNVKGLLYVSKAVLPLLLKNGHAHIVNLGSVAGKQVYPAGNVYNASKFAVDAISQAMRIDLVDEGVKVTEIEPGLVNTEFSLVRFKGDEKTADGTYDGLEPLTAEDIANTIYYAISQPEHVQIAELLVFPKAQASARDTHREE
ncbi:SDR family NAD(P)-dependent oxidoreductase [Lactococcus nasutitermitis]|uniref:SDR family NAD(P)-dependent oxidoreductase n=1 Tax=Lactococcus nasutitermitis TaxID=1652957 RepID=A0ABV9JCW4_9LACT|nr:SDR family NAD(P)-dependent oxidoreductase [Lactococcus nasutitermitis]